MGKSRLTPLQDNLLRRVAVSDLPASLTRDERALIRAGLICLVRRPGVTARLALTDPGRDWVRRATMGAGA